MKLSKNLVVIPLGIFVLSSVVIVNGSTVSNDKYLNMMPSVASNQNDFTLEKVKEIAQKNVPAGSICYYSKEDTYKYEFKFYNDDKMEEYKIEIEKTSQSIVSYKVELYDDIGSSRVNLNETKIKEIVLKEIPKAEILSVELDKDDLLKKYKVKFKVDSYYGKFEVNPETGVILEKEYKLNNEYEYNYNSNNYITIYKVKEIALKEVTNGTITDIDIEYYNTKSVYEVEIKSNNNKYELVLDALTGEKISLTLKNSRAQITENTAKNIISAEEAKQVVLNKVPGAVIKKIELDYDDGVAIYEGEMYRGSYEYEFEINAYTGEIIEWEEDYED